MDKHITQIRFGTINDNITAEELISDEGLRFQDIEQLTIETIPGIGFYLNGQQSKPLYTGISGIYSINLQGSEIASLQFLPLSIQNLVNYNQRNADKKLALLINLVYKKEEEEDGEEDSPSEL